MTTRPSYSFSRTDSMKKPEAHKKMTAVTQPWSSSPTKKTVMSPLKMACQELALCSHQKAHIDAINNTSQFCYKTSLTLVPTLTTTHPILPSTPLIFLQHLSYLKQSLPHPTFTLQENFGPRQLNLPLPITQLTQSWKQTRNLSEVTDLGWKQIQELAHG